ncbi:MAG: EamA family transporter, partial [Paracoccus hibiscisoli]|uniref:EamA family transporter n=1 Tax=Paracoccus hibiscisoli TaxID=2023261 RepID=UPI00391D065C
AASLAGGQVLFKLAASSVPAGGGLFHKLAGLALSPAFVLAIVLYAALSLFWVWILTRIPLSQAYPFVALSFTLTLAAGVLMFGEQASPRLLLGSGLILVGLVVITG